jgi:outer membrane biosynthesis protein TonB
MTGYLSAMNRRFFCSVSTALILLPTFTSPRAIAGEKKKDSPCDKPREMASTPHWSKEDQARARKVRAQGYVNVSIDEQGDVVDAKGATASSREAVDLLLAFARSAKFKPRPGCGTTHSGINYTLAGQ